MKVGIPLERSVIDGPNRRFDAVNSRPACWHCETNHSKVRGSARIEIHGAGRGYELSSFADDRAAAAVVINGWLNAGLKLPILDWKTAFRGNSFHGHHRKRPPNGR